MRKTVKSYDEWKTTNPADEELGPEAVKDSMSETEWQSELHAEIERSKRYAEAKDAIIETMNEAHKVLIAEKDAEIARLKEDVSDLEEQLSVTVRVCNENTDLKRMIIGLLDAAASYLSFDGSDKIYDAVKLQGARVKLRAEIQSARERLLSER